MMKEAVDEVVEPPDSAAVAGDTQEDVPDDDQLDSPSRNVVVDATVL